mgnify:CR=1 FL=1
MLQILLRRSRHDAAKARVVVGGVVAGLGLRGGLAAANDAAGATVVSEVKDQFYGDRSGTLKDPYGHLWFLASRKEDLTEAQIKQRAMEMFQQG